MIPTEKWIVKLCVMLALAAAMSIGPSAFADVDLQITEIWAGGLNDTETISDWFELTNFGDMAATSLDGAMYYDDNSDDPTKDDPLLGVDTIAPGESVIYLVSWEDLYTQVSEAITAFEAMFDVPAGDLSSVQIGYVDGGSGLSSGGDAVNVFDGNTADANTIDRQQYQPWPGQDPVTSYISDPNGMFNATLPLERAQPGVLGAYVGNVPAGTAFGPAIASPGAVVPEPASLSLLALALPGLFGVRRP